MRRWSWLGGSLLCMVAACSPLRADVATPTPVAAATSYVAPLATSVPTAGAVTTEVSTAQPEDVTTLPSIITVEPAAETTVTATAQP